MSSEWPEAVSGPSSMESLLCASDGPDPNTLLITLFILCLLQQVSSMRAGLGSVLSLTKSPASRTVSGTWQVLSKRC